MKENNTTFIIGEIGQNHNGSVDIAKLIIDMVCRPVFEDTFNLNLKPIDAVKLTKRDLREELSITERNKPYLGPNSFGKTYGEHRAFLELSNEEHLEIFNYAKLKGLKFVETLCSKGTLSLLKLFTPDFLKIASRDLNNLPLLEGMAETKIPIILSTGMAGKKELDDALAIVSKYHSKISILHCVSEYPTNPFNANLNSILYLKENFANFTIGYSDHTIGISAPVAAVALGAKIIEKHITIDRRMKGTDQAGSLGADGVFRMIRDIRLTELSLGVKDLFISDAVKDVRIKLERSVAAKRKIAPGEIIEESDVHLLSPGDGIKWNERYLVVGRKAKQTINKDEIIYIEMIE